jgi:hypothetical protein
MNQRKLGAMGECRFAAWCAEVGLTANKSNEDDKGWDYFVEFPFLADNNKSVDMQLSPIKCQVQVKSTDTTDRKKVSVKNIELSNLRYLVNVPMPAFIIFIEYSGLQEPTQAFLVHIDEYIIGKVLKRLRKSENDGKSNKLNKMTLTINYDESHELPSLDGKGLKQAIEKYVGDMSSYVDKKQAILKTIGFDERPVRLTFNLDKKELINFIEASIGLDNKIELNDFKTDCIRFDMAQPLTQKDQGRAYCNLNPNPQYSGVVRFKTDKFSAGVCFDGEMYFSPSFLMPKKSIAFRVKGDFFEIKHIDYSDSKFGNSESTLKFFFHIEINISKLKKVVYFLNAINKNNRFIIQFEKFGDLPLLSFELLSKINDMGSFYDESIETIENTYYLAQYFELEHELSLSLIYLMENKDKINSLSNFLKDDLFNEEISVNSEYLLDVLKNTACIIFPNILLGNYIIGIILGLTGRLEHIEENKYIFLANHLVCKKIVRLKENYDSFKKEFDIEVDNFIAENYENQDIQIIYNL